MKTILKVAFVAVIAFTAGIGVLSARADPRPLPYCWELCFFPNQCSTTLGPCWCGTALKQTCYQACTTYCPD